MTASDAPALLRALFDAACDAARPAMVLPPHLEAWAEPLAGGRLLVLGAGKAAAAMAQVVEDALPYAREGLIVTARGHGLPLRRLELMEAGHPVPDAAGRDAARRALALVSALTARDRVLCLLSGGGSALWPLPLPGITLAQKQALARRLLKSGASIGEINTVRRHLSAIKGGRLAAACHPASVLTLAISDVPGDAPQDIASGPTVGDASTRQQALEVLARHRIPLPEAVRRVLGSPACEPIPPGDARLAGGRFEIVARPQASLEAAAQVARAAGLCSVILGDAIEGEAREVAQVLAGIARQVRRHGQPAAAPCVLLSGGETTVTVRGRGRGGRNVEFLLALALALRGEPGVHALAADTDGVDGAEPVAGALIGPDTLARALARGLDARASLQGNDAHRFFAALGDQVLTGPTLTNVNDFRAILVATG